MLCRVVVLAVVLAVPSLSTARLRAIVAAGDPTSDGFTLSEVGVSAGRTTRDVVFSGSTSALVRRVGDALDVPVQTGDPAPAPLTGIIASIGVVALLPDGTVLFSAWLEQSSAASGLFRLAGDAVEVMEVDPAVRRLATNVRGDVALAVGDSIRFRAAGSAEDVVVDVPSSLFGGRAPRARAMAVGTGGRVAFVSDQSRRTGVAAWDVDNGLRALVTEADGFRDLRAVAVSPTGTVAFIGRTDREWRVFSHSGEPSATPVVVASDPMSGFVAFDDAGCVLFSRTLDDGSVVVLRVDDGVEEQVATLPAGATSIARALDGSLVWVADGVAMRLAPAAATPEALLTSSAVGAGFDLSGPAVTSGGVAVASADRSALLRRRGGRPKLLVHGDSKVRGFGRLGRISAWRSLGRDVLVLGDGASGSEVLAAVRGGKLTSVLQAGVAAPSGGAIDLYDLSSDIERIVPLGRDFAIPVSVSGPELDAFRSEFVRVRAGSRARALLARAPAPADLFEVVRAGKKGLLLDGTDGERSGLFLAHGRGVAPLALAGDAAPGGGTFEWFSSGQATADRVLVVAQFDDAGTERSGAFLWTRRGDAFEGRRLAASGEPIPGGTFSSFELAEGLQPTTVLVASSGEERRTIFSVSDTALRPLVSTGDRTNSGASLIYIDVDSVKSLADGAVAFSATLDVTFGETGPVSGLFVVRRGRIEELVRHGSPTPLGGALVGISSPRLTDDGRGFTFDGQVSGGSVEYAIFSVDAVGR